MARRRKKSPEEVKATRLAFLAKANARKVALRAAGPHMPRRFLQMAMMALSGTPDPAIAERFCIQVGRVRAILRRPDVRAEMDKIVAAQKERLIAGEFGVGAMAKAAAPAAAQTIIDQATGKVDVKPADAHKAAVSVLKLSGDMQEKKVTEHVHRLIKEFTTDELQAWLAGRGMPPRLRDQFRLLGIEAPAIEVEPS